MNLKQLAEHLNLSQTTVSRALNGYPEVREATRLRVQKAAAEHHYTPNARAKGLATGRAMSIGHIISTSKKHEMVNPVFGDFITGASEAYVEAGYDMVLTLVEDGDEARLYRNIRDKGNVDGIIVHGPRMNDSRIGLLTSLGLPFVVHGRASDVTRPYSWIDMNNRRAFERAAGFLTDLGHRRIALINGLEFMDFAHRRREGYLAALATAETAPDTALMRQGEMTEVLGFRAASEMLALVDPPTAFLTSSMVTAIGVRRALADRGLEMGRDVSVITHDDDLSYMPNGTDEPIFTAVRSSVRNAGNRAAKMLLRMIAEPDCAPLQFMLEAELILGRSTGPARPRQT
ncbi:LacI family DNA-binding transcriptional regulator [Puniceibacterium sp. IMCC21224]|uniref:LacI family DNA-binding transcriptional regulator n=1 Tax=Puniceibacterium sp. IMCC21224 TaxID=1618204 RepID=UPI00064DB0B1|nr:substrate-binding domain-containing protein [Puniceibacterium sp. IMCC21224]KMK67430.1 transcriptional regulator, LacI family [Puniceibacterium sp. IMCC21224]